MAQLSHPGALDSRNARCRHSRGAPQQADSFACEAARSGAMSVWRPAFKAPSLGISPGRTDTSRKYQGDRPGWGLRNMKHRVTSGAPRGNQPAGYSRRLGARPAVTGFAAISLPLITVVALSAALL